MGKSKTIEKTPVSPETLASFEALVAEIPGLERKGATIPYTSLNGHMFAYINTDGQFVLRLPKKELEEFITKYKTEHPISYGALMKEYAIVPEKLLKKTKELLPYFRTSYDYIATLKPKPSRSKKAK